MSIQSRHASIFTGIIVLSIILLTGCTAPPNSETDFERMLGYMPASLAGQPIWYADWAKSKEINGWEEFHSFSEFNAYRQQLVQDGPPPDQATLDWSIFNQTTGPRWIESRLKDYIGFDIMGVDRIVYFQYGPSMTIVEADFDVDNIAGLLAGLDYEETNYDGNTYWDQENSDFEDKSNIQKNLIGWGMCQAVLSDDRILFTSSTRRMEDILDILNESAEPSIDDPAVRAVANSLGDPYYAFITTPENLCTTSAPYYFTIPDDWGLLHYYDMAGIGYYYDGKSSYLNIVLHYASTDAAREDGEEIAKRVVNYIFNTIGNPESDLFFPHEGFTDLFELEDRKVMEYDNGAILKLTLRLLPEGRRGGKYLMYAAGGGLPDILFLIPDPSQYVAE